jgi:hypothetical protein
MNCFFFNVIFYYYITIIRVSLKLAHNSVILGGVTAELLIDDTQTKQAAANFIQAYTSKLRDAGGRTADQNMATCVTSFISQSAPGGP